MNEIIFFSSTNSYKFKTKGSKEWWEVLKSRWDIKHTQMRDNETDIIIMHYERTQNLYVGNYDKISKLGVVYDRRKEVRV